MKPSQYQSFRVRHHVGAAAGDDLFPAPIIDPNAFSVVPEEFKDKKLLSANVRANPIAVTLAIPIGYFAGDFVDLRLDGTTIFGEGGRSLTKTENDTGRVVIEIPPELRTDEKEYHVTYGFAGGVEAKFLLSEPASFRTKYAPPGDRPDGSHLGPLAFTDPSLPQTGLTSAKLTELGNVLTATVSSYNGREEGDLIRPEVVLLTGGTPIEAATVRVPLGGVDKEIDVEFTRADLEALGDGIAVFRYYVEDLAGNKSQVSNPVRISLLINGTSIVLDPPTVPVFDHDGIIDEANARPGVAVEVPGNAKLNVGDIIVVSWGTRKMPGVPVMNPAATPMMTVTIPYSDISDEGTGNVPVTYSAWSGTTVLGQPDNPTEVKVNLNQPGGKDPDPDTPENEALGKPMVRENGWKSGQPVNKIDQEASDKNATFIIPWFTNQSTPTAAFIDGDVLDLYYNGDKFDTYTVTATDVTSKSDLVVELPATEIQKFGSGVFDVQYVGLRAIGQGISNSAYSPKQKVIVESKGDLPGGGDPLAGATFAARAITTEVARQGVSLTVPMYKNVKNSDTISIDFTANWGLRNQGPEITLAAYQKTKTVGLQDIDDGGVQFTIPADHALYLYPTGIAHLKYTATNEYGSVTSPTVDIQCDTRAQASKAPEDPDRPNPPIE